jgi:hypothetical protein
MKIYLLIPISFFLLFCDTNNQKEYEYMYELILKCEYENFYTYVKKNNINISSIESNADVTLGFAIIPNCKDNLLNEDNGWIGLSKKSSTFKMIEFLRKNNSNLNYTNSLEHNILYNKWNYPSTLYGFIENNVNINAICGDSKTVLGLLIRSIKDKYILFNQFDGIEEFDEIDDSTIEKLMSVSYLIEKGGKLSDKDINPYEYLLEESKKRPLLYEYLIENGLPKPDILIKKD